MKKIVSLIALAASITCSMPAFSNQTFTDKSAWEAAAPGPILDEPSFGGCMGDVAARNCTDYPNGIFTDTKFLGQVESAIYFYNPSGVQHGNFSAIGFNIDTGGVDIGGKISFSLGLSNQKYFLPTSFTGGYFGINSGQPTQINSINIIPMSNTPTTFTLSNFQTSVPPASPAPEPETYAMLMIGLASISLLNKKLS
ncbi:MAG: PEP-CTERM sorting domain-containing protein [Pseudomonadota bacterium]